jgi:hypothetical protein
MHDFVFSCRLNPAKQRQLHSEQQRLQAKHTRLSFGTQLLQTEAQDAKRLLETAARFIGINLLALLLDSREMGTENAWKLI